MSGPGGTFSRVRPAAPSRPAAGSTDNHHEAPAAGARTDPTVTHNSRPAPAAPVPGTNTGVTLATGHSVELSAPAPGGALGPAYSLAPAGSVDDRSARRVGRGTNRGLQAAARISPRS